MLKKILLGTLFAGLIGILVTGAIIRTTDKTGLAANARGRGKSETEAYTTDRLGQSYGSNGQGNARGSSAERQSPYDESSRPAWAGTGQNAQGSNPGRYAGQGREDALGEAYVEEWLTLQGTVVNVDADTLVVQTDSGEQVIVENRAWWFIQEQAFSVQVGDEVTMTGFYESNDPSTSSERRFEVGRIDDTTTGQAALVRDENGRPLWAGRGWRGG
jgi:hypothetical protein